MTIPGALDEVRRHWRRPAWWRHTALPRARQRLHAACLPVVRAVHAGSGRVGCHVTAEDWDTLVVLDACRYDVFERYNRIDGTLSNRRSLGSATAEFLEANFAGEELLDTVYVTAHPYVSLQLDDPFHALIDAWETEWSEELKTVPPDGLTRVAREAADAFPYKRLIVHYLQPHYPFVGDVGRREIAEQAGVEYTRRQVANERPRRDHEFNAWEQLARGTISAETVWEAYCENLRLALPNVETLVEHVDGRTVVTSDHGNLFGTQIPPVPIRLYGHPAGVHVDELVEVPWLVVDDGTRREITAEPPRNPSTPADRGAAIERLRQLGYREG